MTAVQWLVIICTIAIVGYIGVPLILKAIRDRDFEAQVKGKKAMRNADEKMVETLLTHENHSIEAEADEYVMRMKSKQNFFGPKGR